MPANTPESPSTPVVLASGTNAAFSHTITVRGPSSRIWALWMDVANWPSWDTELKEARAQGPLALDVEGTLLPKQGPASRFKVVAFEQGRRYAFETALPLAKLTVSRELRQDGDATTFTHDVQFCGLAGPVFAWYFGPKFRVVLPAVMQRLAQRSQQQAETAL
jgi:Polyketide cyclase / dehydrase and lipid transport